MRSLEEFERVIELVESGVNNCAISRATEIPLSTVQRWHKQHEGGLPPRKQRPSACFVCDASALDERAYAYLLGLYLGDGCLVPQRRGVYRLEVALDQTYPNIISDAREAINAIKRHGRPSGCRHREGCDVIYSYWKHWVCLFPQHGSGPKPCGISPFNGGRGRLSPLIRIVSYEDSFTATAADISTAKSTASEHATSTSVTTLRITPPKSN
jgi:hypothetical protein